MTVQQKKTRFRAYQLGIAGSSYSYFDGTRFTLIEARYCEGNQDSIEQELALCGVQYLHALHITSWDQDHCVPSQLETILQKYKPYKIEYPGYAPHSDSGKESLSVIQSYEHACKTNSKVVQVTPEYIGGLDSASNYGYNDVFHNPKIITPNSSNDNSTVKHFRSGSFNLLSLGDVESTQISSRIRSQSTVNKETDVMILAHHGADNGFTTSSFLKVVRPSVAIACADYANKFEHPKQNIRDLLHKYGIKLFTTKTGDVVVFSIGNHIGHYRLVNLKAGSSEISSQCDFKAKKLSRLSVNTDTLRARTRGTNRGPKKH
jgi:competence protein ComEC